MHTIGSLVSSMALVVSVPSDRKAMVYLESVIYVLYLPRKP